VTPTIREDASRAVADVLAEVAERIAEKGTESERLVLDAMSDATRAVAPGAAMALVDWAGSEVARLRAYGLLHGLVLHALDRDDHAWLLDRVHGVSGDRVDDRVA
jgi:hypothetical protein